jgi:hypothetical protein
MPKKNLPSDGFEQCIKSLIGSKYEISLSKLLNTKPKQRESQPDINRTFFCSELVAEIYVRLGLLPQSRVPSSYWPKHFTEDLPLLNGRLSDLMVVELNWTTNFTFFFIDYLSYFKLFGQAIYICCWYNNSSYLYW